MLVNLLENLIVKKFYENKEEIQRKLDVFYAMSKIADEDYSNLTLRVEEVYFVAEEVTENSTEVDRNETENTNTEE